MPRGQRRHRDRSQQEAASAPIVPGQVAESDRGARTVIFSKTKMCKFHILGMCSKGSGCKFAHQKEELNPLPDLTRTKLCKTLISTGSCEDPNCSYAHNKEELRLMPDGPQSNNAPQAAAGSPQPPWGPSNQAAFQQMFNGMQAAMQWAQQQQALQGGGRVGTPVVPGPVMTAPPGPAAQPGWMSAALGQPTRGVNGAGQQPPQTKVVSLCEGLSLQAKQPEKPEKASLARQEVPLNQDFEQDFHPRVVVKNTFIDLALDEAPRPLCPRSNTWSASLCAMVRSDSRDSVLSLTDPESPMLNALQAPCAVPPMEKGEISPTNLRTRTGSINSLECVPEKRRLPSCGNLATFGERQFSEESETSTTDNPPETEKRHQDTPLDRASGQINSSQDSLSTLEEGSEPEQPSPRTNEAEAQFKIKNTFIELEEGDPQGSRPLRAVQTAMGRLDVMA